MKLHFVTFLWVYDKTKDTNASWGLICQAVNKWLKEHKVDRSHIIGVTNLNGQMECVNVTLIDMPNLPESIEIWVDIPNFPESTETKVG